MVRASDGTRRELRTRRILLCTGLDGMGGPSVPTWAEQLPPSLWAHSSDAIDFDRLSGQRVAVIGTGASAFDNAASALEAGAEVVQFGRRSSLPTINTLRSLENRGVFRHYSELSDAVRVDVARRVLSRSTPPPEHSVARCRRHSGYELRLGSPWTGANVSNGRVLPVIGEQQSQEFDFVIFGTGFDIDLDRVEWLSGVREGISLWRDHAELDSTGVDALIGRHPYLGTDMACVGTSPDSHVWAGRIFMLNAAGVVSAGPSSIGINALATGSDNVVAGICRSLFREQAEEVVSAFMSATSADAADPVGCAMTRPEAPGDS